MRADAIQTDTNGLNAGMASVAVQGGNMPVYFARPANVANPPVILVCMEIFGLHEWVKDITRRVGHLGAYAIAPDYYFRAETNGVDLTKISDMQKLFPIVNAQLPPSALGCAPAECQILGAACGSRPRPPLARSGKARGGPRSARSGLRLVHRRLRHARSERGEGVAR